MTRSTAGQAATSGLFNSSNPAVTPDGRYVVFESNATNLVAPATSGQQIFLRDRVLGTTELVSVNSTNGSAGNQSSNRPAISADGCRIVFWSNATNLATSATTAAGYYDVFLRERCLGATTALDYGNASSKNPDISADGRWVVFESNATNILGSVIDTHGTSQVYVYDLQLDTATLISAAVIGGTPGQGGGFASSFPAISADGSRVAFWSFASDLVTGDANGAWDIFLWDKNSGTPVSLVSTAANGTQRNQGNESTSRIVEPAISADGRYVSFATTSTNLVACGATCSQNVFVKDTQTGSIVLASVTTGGGLGNGDSPTEQGGRAALSGDGNRVIFTTSAANLTSDGQSGNVVIRDFVSLQTLTLTPHASFGVGVRPAISGDAGGRYAAFFSSASLDPNFQSPGSGVFVFNPQSRSDFNADSRSDILWRNLSTGDNAIFVMNGFTLIDSRLIGGINPAWHVVGVGDFNGDGKADILWRNPATGDNAIFLMNGFTLTNSALIGGINPAWNVVGVGDFDGDGKADILWRNPATGDNAIFLMNGFTLTNSALIGGINPAWNVVGVGDFDGDGKADILWRNPTTGDNAIFEMNGFTLTDSRLIGGINPAWNVVGVGDFDADGKADILWRNPTSGDNAIFKMSGFTLVDSRLIGGINPAWNVVGVGDYDGDGKADILWRNPTTGDNAIFVMNGFTLTDSRLIGGINPAWSVVGY